MIEREPYSVVRSNERAKLGSRTFANLATALVAAIAYRLFVEIKPDGVTLLWIMVATVLIWSAYAILELLEPEA